jgi:hypothetical protein
VASRRVVRAVGRGQMRVRENSGHVFPAGGLAMTTMNDIQKQAREYSDARQDLEVRVKKLAALKDHIEKRYMPGITRALLALVEAKEALRGLVDAARDLFEKPKTQIFSGVKIGLKKGKGKIEWDDDDAVVKRIKKNHPELVDQLIIREEKPSKKGLATLDVKQLKALGVSVEEAGDQVVVKDMDSEIEKIIKALMKSEEEERAECEA